MAVVAAAEPPASGASSSSVPASSSSPLATIRIIDTVIVQPSPSASDPALPQEETSLPLTYFDVFWLHSPPVERLFLYRLGPDANVDAIVSNLKSSLSHAIRAFYPLAGRIRRTPGTDGRYELHYRPGDGVAFTVAEAESDRLDVDALATDDAREVAAVAPLLPPLPGGGALLALQVTLLSGRRGIALGVTVHHAACDGAASTHFIHTWAAWAAAAAQAQQEATPLAMPQPPVIDRSLVSDERGLYDIFYEARPSEDEMEFVKMRPDQLLSTFVLSTADLQRIKDAVAAEATARGGVSAPPRCSSLVATLGLVWSCYLRAKNTTTTTTTSNNNDVGATTTCLLFPVDHRTRMTPPLPDKYLGNCVGPAFALAPTASLTEPLPGGVFDACVAVGDAIREAVTEIGTPAMDAWMERVREASRMRTLSVAGSPRFRVYEVDFGFGRPAKVDIVSVARTGAVAVAESQRSEEGGMEVGVSLPPDGMARFRECFADAMAWLRANNGQLFICMHE